MIRWWENGKLQDPIEDPIEDSIERTYRVIGWGNYWKTTDNSIYVLEKKFKNNYIVLSNDYKYRSSYPINYRILTVYNFIEKHRNYFK